jgi:hypothetical protein
VPLGKFEGPVRNLAPGVRRTRRSGRGPDVPRTGPGRGRTSPRRAPDAAGRRRTQVEVPPDGRRTGAGRAPDAAGRRRTPAPDASPDAAGRRRRTSGRKVPNRPLNGTRTGVERTAVLDNYGRIFCPWNAAAYRALRAARRALLRRARWTAGANPSVFTLCGCRRLPLHSHEHLRDFLAPL